MKFMNIGILQTLNSSYLAALAPKNDASCIADCAFYFSWVFHCFKVEIYGCRCWRTRKKAHNKTSMKIISLRVVKKLEERR